MKFGTWIDRLAGVLLALGIARLLGPQALSDWSVILVVVWVLSPWPEGTVSTRVLTGLSSLGLVLVMSRVWPWAWERHELVWTIAVAMFGVRIVHALPGRWTWRILGSTLSFAAALIVLHVTRSVLAASVTVASASVVAAVIGLLRYHTEWGTWTRLPLKSWMTSCVITFIQAQTIVWAHVWQVPDTNVGELAAALFLLELLKGGLMLVTARFDSALQHFVQARESFLETVRALAAYSFLVMPPLVLVVYFSAGPLMTMALGSAFSGSVSLLKILIWGFGFSFLSLVGLSVLHIRKVPTFKIRLFSGVLEAALGVFWIPTLGVEGAAYARVVGEALLFLLVSIKVYHAVPDLVNPFRKTYG